MYLVNYDYLKPIVYDNIKITLIIEIDYKYIHLRLNFKKKRKTTQKFKRKIQKLI